MISIIVDLHCDTISLLCENNGNLYNNSGHYDIKRAIDVNIGLQFFALFINPADSDSVLRRMLLQLCKYRQELEKHSSHLYPVYNYADVEHSGETGRVGALLHLEGGEALGNNPEMLDLLFQLGLRSLGLTWNYRNWLADGVAEGEYAGGISKYGREIIRKMKDLGIILDLSHLAEIGYYEAINLYEQPVMVTHANARTLCNHPRNLNDRQLRVLADNNGVVGINQVADFVKTENASLNDLLDHVVYIAELIGCQYIALGSDFDGADKVVMPGIQTYRDWPSLLEKRGFNQDEIEGILSGNALRVIKETIPG